MMIKGTFIGTNEIFLCSKKEISVVFNAMDIDIYFGLNNTSNYNAAINYGVLV